MSDESTTQQVQGFSEGEMTRGDWSEFHVNIGRQYPVKLATKREEVKQAARAAGQQQAVWTYNESQGNPNPHKPGEFFKNRYLEAVEVGGQMTIAPQQGQQGASNAPQGAGVSPVQMPSGARDRSIERQVIIKEMVQHYPGIDALHTAEWWALMGKIDDFMVNGVERADAPPPADEATYIPTADIDDVPF